MFKLFNDKMISAVLDTVMRISKQLVNYIGIVGAHWWLPLLTGNGVERP